MADWWSPLRSVLPANTVKQFKARGIETVADLLQFRPRTFIDPTGSLERLQADDYVTFYGTVESLEVRRLDAKQGRRARTLVKASVRSGAHRITLTFFNKYPHADKLTSGREGFFAGKVSRFRNEWQLTHPVYEVRGAETDDADDLHDEGEAAEAPELAGLRTVFDRPIVPVYREVAGMPSWRIAQAVEATLATVDLPDPVPEHLLEAHGLLDFGTAVRASHLPETHDERWSALRRLKYDEALVIQLALAQRRLEQWDAPAVPRSARPGGLLEAFDAALPFTLTSGQVAVGEEIATDLARTHPMNRLLQGDVGSGKTVVALRAMLAVIDAGGQAALLAPTEVLAQQHYRSVLALLGPLAEGGMLGGAEQGTRVALLVGGDSASRRKASLLQAASGEAGIVVGTHALLQEHVQFADLGLVVVDEQHRFGVEQRDALRDKAKHSPHMLVMTATPIPRTVAMTVFGDMDTSVLRELPAGRAPIQTSIVDNPRWYERAWQRVAEEAAAGRQTYVVCPRIGDEASDGDGADGFEEIVEALTDDWDPWAEAGEHPGEQGDAARDPRPPMRGVLEVHRELSENPVLAGLRIDVLHGRMSSDEKDAKMADFAAGRTHVLVSTTVVEVGVDVAGATVMMVMDADRFGVSQLHQLRGRVGRGGLPGLCLLVVTDPPESARERIEAVAATTDGFELSRHDLRSRREGNILGARQSGRRSALRVLSLTGRDDEKIIEMARRDASDVIAADASLSEFPDLFRMLHDRLDETQVDYLGKG